MVLFVPSERVRIVFFSLFCNEKLKCTKTNVWKTIWDESDIFNPLSPGLNLFFLLFLSSPSSSLPLAVQLGCCKVMKMLSEEVRVTAGLSVLESRLGAISLQLCGQKHSDSFHRTHLFFFYSSHARTHTDLYSHSTFSYIALHIYW